MSMLYVEKLSMSHYLEATINILHIATTFETSTDIRKRFPQYIYLISY